MGSVGLWPRRALGRRGMEQIFGDAGGLSHHTGGGVMGDSLGERGRLRVAVSPFGVSGGWGRSERRYRGGVLGMNPGWCRAVDYRQVRHIATWPRVWPAEHDLAASDVGALMLVHLTSVNLAFAVPHIDHQVIRKLAEAAGQHLVLAAPWMSYRRKHGVA